MRLPFVGSASKVIGLILGFLFFLLFSFWPALFGPESLPLSTKGYFTLAVTALMGIWWVTEALPIPAVALLPLFLFPVLGVFSFKEAAVPYSHPLIYLFMGGFMIAASMEKWNLHKRMALQTIRIVGTKPRSMIGGFMLATAFLSAWVSNTAVVTMMLPIALAVLATLGPSIAKSGGKDSSHFSISLMLGMAYAASIGGTATLIGTPPNALFAAFFEREFGITISFLDWLKVGLPFALIFLPIVWFILTTVLFPLKIKEIPQGKELIGEEISKLGLFRKPEKRVLCIFVLVAFLWVTRPLLESLISNLGIHLDDSTIAIFGVLLLFLLPSGEKKGEKLLDWESARQIRWGVLILFGGGLSMAAALREHGVAQFIGQGVSTISTAPIFWLILGTALAIIFLTEVTSNTATTAAFLPILTAIAMGAAIHPYALCVPTVLAASCAFMMPVATPPNAIIFASGQVTIPQMCRAGIWLNIIGVILISFYVYFALPLLWGVDFSVSFPS